jgi:natural product precursor
MKLNKIKLHELSDVELNEREMRNILGGYSCGCNYAGQPGGSSTSENGEANKKYGYTSATTMTPLQVVCVWNCNPQDNTCH